MLDLQPLPESVLPASPGAPEPALIAKAPPAHRTVAGFMSYPAYVRYLLVMRYFAGGVFLAMAAVIVYAGHTNGWH